MIRFLKRNKLVALLSSLLVVLVSAVALSTVAWFTQTNNLTGFKVTSKILETYFGGGTGLAGDPLIISEPVHYYNLAYLHENDTMKLTGWTKTFAKQGLYIQFGKNVGTSENPKYLFYNYSDSGKLLDSSTPTSTTLNMNYYNGTNGTTQIIPLGSSDHPFIGHISGNNLTVSNLHITSKYENAGVAKGLSDIGIFGYVSAGASISNCYFEKPVIDVSYANASTNTEAQAHTSHVYVGYLAGHTTSKSLFTNDYVNGAQIKNTTGVSYEHINSTGFFGKADDVNVQPAASSSYGFGLDADNVYSALNYASTEGGGSTFITRPGSTQYTPEGKTFNQAVTSSSGTYTFNEYDTGQPYSLSSMGYRQGQATQKHVRYLNHSGVLVNLPSDTNLSLASSNYAKPQTWETAGKYVYYENGQWYYNIVSDNGGGQTTTTNFNCFYVTIVQSGTTYYWVYNDNNTASDLTDDTLKITNAAPTAQTQDKYNFVFRENNNGTVSGGGISEFSDVSEDKQAYIYSPAYKTYLYAKCPNDVSSSSPTNFFTPVFKEELANATVFNVGSYDSKITFMGDETNNGSNTGNTVVGTFFYTSSTTIGTHKYTIQSIGDAFTIGTPVDSHGTLTGNPYQKVTNLNQLSNDDKIALIAYSSTNSKYYGMGAAASNNFPGVEVSVSNDQIINTSSLTKLRFKISFSDPNDLSTVQYQFMDLYTTDNLSNQESNDKTGDGAKRRLQFKPTACYYSISLSNGEASIQSVTYNVVNKHLRFYYSSTDKLFNSYTDTHIKPMIFKRASLPASNLDGYKSSSRTVPYQEATSITKIEDPYYIYVSDYTAANPDSLTYNTLFVDAPTASTAFDVTTNTEDSTVTTVESVTNYWRRVTSEYQMNSGGKYIIVNESENNALSTTQNSGEMSATGITITSGFIKGANLSSSVQQFTGSLSDGKWTFAVASGYLSADSSSTNSLVISPTLSNDAKFTVTYDISGNATVKFQGGTYNLLGYDSSNDVFSAYSSATGTIQIYMLVENGASNSTYVGDLIGGLYDPSRIDVVGQASVGTDSKGAYITLDEACAVTKTNQTGQNLFYTTKEVSSGGIVLIIDKTDSNDLGSLVITYECSSTDRPYFKNKNGETVTFATAKARDGATAAELSDNIHKDVVNFTNDNISTYGYCGINSSTGKITAISGSYSSTTDKYVIVIGASSSIKIRDVNFSFLSVPGNISSFTSVDFRSATYSNGVFDSEHNDQPSSPGIAIYYDVNDPTLTIDVRVKFEVIGTVKTYTIYVVSNKATTINVFLYDEDAALIVNGVGQYKTTNEISISANYSPPSPWY